MNILITTGHPAQIHNFKNLKFELENKGHKIFWLASDKDISKNLLKCYGIDYNILDRPGKSYLAKTFTLIKNIFITLRFIREKKIDLGISRVSPYVAVSSFLLGKTHLALTDTETAGFYDKFFGRFASVLLTANSFQRSLFKGQIRFDGNIELFYLHPNRFQPDEDIFELLGLKKDYPYVIMRFVSWDAYHEKGLSGFTDANKIKAVKEFSKHATVFISAEKRLPPELEPYRIRIPPEKMHDALAYASLFFGESPTMASESAVLGTPAIFLDKIGRGYTDEEEKYGLVFNYKDPLTDQGKAITKGVELLANPNTKKIMKENQTKFLKDKIDVTAFMVWFIENYPESFKIMKQKPDYQQSYR